MGPPKPRGEIHQRPEFGLLFGLGSPNYSPNCQIRSFGLIFGEIWLAEKKSDSDSANARLGSVKNASIWVRVRDFPRSWRVFGFGFAELALSESHSDSDSANGRGAIRIRISIRRMDLSEFRALENHCTVAYANTVEGCQKKLKNTVRFLTIISLNISRIELLFRL